MAFLALSASQRDRLGYSVDHFLDAARRAQNAVIHYLGRGLKQSLPSSMNKLVKNLRAGTTTLPTQPHLADKWLRKAEKLAKLEPQRGSLWHAYRRKWVTERKHHPNVDVAAAGGWKSVETLRAAYQQPDPRTMLRVVLEPGELREAR